MASTKLLIVCSYHVTCAFQSESTLYSCLSVKELLARNMCEMILSLSLAKWLSFRLRTEWFWVRVPLQSLKISDIQINHNNCLGHMLIT